VTDALSATACLPSLQNSSQARRYLAAWFPFLPTDRLLRRTGAAPDDAPLVVAEPVKGALRLSAVSREAARLGLGPGLTLADARARIPKLRVEAADPAADAALLERMADDCDRYTPVVTIDAPDGLLLDMTGCVDLFGGETALLREVGLRFRKGGVGVRIVIAGAPDTARALARYGRGGTVPSGGDAGAVRGLPVGALRLPEEARVALVRAGLKTIGDLADRPSQALVARFGDQMIVKLRRTLGYELGPVTPRRIVAVCSAEQRFAEPIGRMEDVEGVLAALAAEACTLLAERREGGRIFEASFFRADGAVRRIAVETGRPLRDVASLMRLFRERLETLADPVDPGFGFDLIRLSAPVVEPLDPAQVGLDGRRIDDDAVAELVERLSTRFGRERVLRFEPRDTHDPNRAVAMAPAVENRKTKAAWPALEPDEPPLRPVQMFVSPQPIDVTAQAPDSPPRQFIWRRTKHVVVRAEGPERISAEWWRRGIHAPTRDYFRVEDSEGRRFWLFREGLYGGETSEPRWFMHGVFA